jgi:hypothetical protein
MVISKDIYVPPVRPGKPHREGERAFGLLFSQGFGVLGEKLHQFPAS